MIEGVFARGDRRLGKVLYQAWQDGAKFDGWSDLYQHDTWLKAFETCGVDMALYNERQRDFNEALPWGITSPGVNKEFLLREWHHAMAGALTEDCRRGKCSACGICPNLGVHVIDHAGEQAAPAAEAADDRKPQQDPRGPGKPRTLYTYRAEITKGDELRYVSHLDYANIFIRAFDRAKLPMAYSEGFNHHMKVAFASALSLGVSSEAEYMDFELTKELCQPEVFDRLQAQLPPGIQLRELRLMQGKHKALMAESDEARYTLHVPYRGTEDEAQAAIKAYNAAKEVLFHRVTPKKKREIETKQYMIQPVTARLQGEELVLQMDIRITQSGSVKPLEILRAIADQFGLAVDPAQALITRTGLFGHGKRLIELV